MKIFVVSTETGDWDCIYVNGVLKRQGHSLGYKDAFEVLDISYERKTISEKEFEEKKLSQFPTNLSDLFKHTGS